jgi:phage-related protein
MTQIEKLISGRRYDIFAITVHRKCQVSGFIDGLEAAEQKKVVALLQRTADYGPPNNMQKFRKLQGDIWEFKSFQVRILCAFEDRNIIILTHGFIKKQDKTPPDEIERAKRLLTEYYERR